MQNEVSCWYVDWNAIGTWVGGVGSILAAVVAILLATRETKRRRGFAKFLLIRDVKRLAVLVDLLRHSAEAMSNFATVSHQEEQAEYLRDVGDKGLQALQALPSQLEFFGRSDRLYDFGGTTSDFEELNSAVNVILGLDEILNWTFKYYDEDAAAQEIFKACTQLTQALKSYESDLATQ